MTIVTFRGRDEALAGEQSVCIEIGQGAIRGAIGDEFLWNPPDVHGQELRNTNGSWTSADNRTHAGDRWHARGQGFESPQLHR